jgi:hypothetical protein
MLSVAAWRWMNGFIVIKLATTYKPTTGIRFQSQTLNMQITIGPIDSDSTSLQSYGLQIADCQLS